MTASPTHRWNASESLIRRNAQAEQDDRVNCGVYVIKTMEKLSRADARDIMAHAVTAWGPEEPFNFDVLRKKMAQEMKQL
jgi:hypothetical protein